jgi:hypothetical protein
MIGKLKIEGKLLISKGSALFALIYKLSICLKRLINFKSLNNKFWMGKEG